MALSKVDVRTHHESLDLERGSGEFSSCHTSLPSAPSGLPRTDCLPLASAASPDGLPSTTNHSRTTVPSGVPPQRTQRSISTNVPITRQEQSTRPAVEGLPAFSQTLSPHSVHADDASQDNVQQIAAPSSLPPSSPPSSATLAGLPTIDSRSQTLPSRHFSISEVRRDDGQRSATVGASIRRALAPRLATLPPPMMAGYNADGRARLTPSLVTRQAPMPLLNLPMLPPPTPSLPGRPGRPTAPLRSIPALPMQGPSDADQEADHENASLEEEEEEEEGEENASAEGQDGDSGESGDEDDHEYSSPRQPSATGGTPRLGALPHVDTSGFSVSFGDATSVPTQRTPHAQAGSSLDYFTSKSPERAFSPMRTPRPVDFTPHGQDVPQLRTVPMPSTPGSPRPGLYHLGSRSMVDLLSTRKEKDKIISPKLGHALSRKRPQAFAAAVEGQPAPVEEEPPAPESPDDVINSPMLRRRRSLPVYEPSSDPPPYPDLQFQRKNLPPKIVPRDEEGREQLPAYSNAIHLVGVMPRKMEFTQPGVQAKDRKWRRVYCVLEGTMFCVYKAPPAESAVSAIEQWWESKVGVGDITSVDVTAMTASGIRVNAVRERPRDDLGSERPQKISEEREDGQGSAPNGLGEAGSSRPPSPQLPASRSRLHLGSRLLLHRQRSKSVSRLGSNSSNSSSRVSIDRPSASQSHSYMRRSMDTLGSSRMSNVSSAASHTTTSTGLTIPSPTSSTLNASPTSSSDSASRFSRSRHMLHTHSSGDGKDKEKEKEAAYVPDPKDLLRKYSMQHAESGLASDYVKRKNVIRVRMEGEQFLLQAKDVASVIDWIEVRARIWTLCV